MDISINTVIHSSNLFTQGVGDGKCRHNFTDPNSKMGIFAR
jgi:hypothetical protein